MAVHPGSMLHCSGAHMADGCREPRADDAQAPQDGVNPAILGFLPERGPTPERAGALGMPYRCAPPLQHD